MDDLVKRKLYIVNLIVFSVYVLVEIMFNSYLLDVAASSTSTKEQYDWAELIGRCVSSTGVAIFIGFFYFKKRGRIPFVLILVCWFGFFLFQKGVLELLVSNSSAKQKQVSFLLQSAVKASRDDLNLSHFGAAGDFERIMLPSYKMLYYGGDEAVVDAVTKITYNNVVNNKELLVKKEKEINKALVSITDTYVNAGEQVIIQVDKTWIGLQKTHSAVLALRRKAYSAAKANKSRFRKLVSLVEWGFHNGCTSGKRLEYTRMVAANPILKGSLLCSWVENEASKSFTFRNNPDYFYNQVQHIAVQNHFYGVPPRMIKHKFDEAIKDPVYQRFLLLQVIEKFCHGSEFSNKGELFNRMSECGLFDKETSFAYWLAKLPEEKRVVSFLRSAQGSKIVKNNIKINPDFFLNNGDENKLVDKQLAELLTNELAKNLTGDEDEFYLGGKMHTDGSDSIRVLFAVPIALMLSLLFSLLGSARLLCDAIKPFCDSKKSSSYLFTSMVIVVLFIPFGGEYGSYKDSTVMSWALKYQPIVYFVGKRLRDTTFSW